MNASRLIELGAHDHRMHATSQAGCSAWSLQVYSAHSLAASANGMQFGGWWSQLADGRTCEPSHTALPNHQATDDAFTDSNRPGTHALPDKRDVGGQGDDDKHSQDGIGVVLRLWGKGMTPQRNDR